MYTTLKLYPLYFQEQTLNIYFFTVHIKFGVGIRQMPVLKQAILLVL